jgi:hypothetical protein
MLRRGQKSPQTSPREARRKNLLMRDEALFQSTANVPRERSETAKLFQRFIYLESFQSSQEEELLSDEQMQLIIIDEVLLSEFS